MKPVKVSCYCICGASWTGTLPPRMADELGKKFAESHNGTGHDVYPTRKAANEAKKKARQC